MKTRVHLTTDVECAEERCVRNQIQPPVGYDLRVWGRFANQREELGIGLIMRELETGGLRGTFFVEVLGSQFFGSEGLAEICDAIRRRGHDVQLHLHPIFKRPEWRRQNLEALPDNIADYSREQQTTFLREGLQILADCGVPADQIVAFRAGNYGANNETWLAMSNCGLRLSSSFNLTALGGDCRITWPRAEVGLFDTGAGVWELPISNFVEPAGGHRHLQITAVSLAEMIWFLREARRRGIEDVTIVMHSFEFFHLDSVSERRGRPNRVNIHRLRGLCRFLRNHTHEFEVETLAALTARLPAVVATNGNGARPPRASRWRRWRRVTAQAYKRLEERVQTL